MHNKKKPEKEKQAKEKGNLFFLCGEEKNRHGAKLRRFGKTDNAPPCRYVCTGAHVARIAGIPYPTRMDRVATPNPTCLDYIQSVL